MARTSGRVRVGSLIALCYAIAASLPGSAGVSLAALSVRLTKDALVAENIGPAVASAVEDQGVS